VDPPPPRVLDDPVDHAASRRQTTDMYLRALENEARLARPSSQRKKAFEHSSLEVRMFNVGHGEVILVIFPDDRTWLIDGGSSNSPGVNSTLGQRLINYLEARVLVLEAFVPSIPTWITWARWQPSWRHTLPRSRRPCPTTAATTSRGSWVEAIRT
jgi:hypothetical protein